ncbi:MAG: lipoprotein insertase outer membrane protein LolB [Francisella sp.]
MQSTISQLKIDIKVVFSLVIALIFIGLLSSCSTTSANISDIESQKVFNKKDIYNKLLNLKKWQVSGVIGIIYNNKAESANYIYQQDEDAFDIKLYGPLGVGSIEIKGNKNGVCLENAKGQKLTAKDIKTLMLEQLGWYVPVNGLQYWIKGISMPNIKQKSQFNTHNLLQSIDQNGWNIQYGNYKIIDNIYPLPIKIKMIRDNLNIKIIIKSWQIPKSENTIAMLK